MKAAVIAAIVSAVVASATATAGTVALITGAQIKNGSVGLVDIAPKAKRALKGQRGPRGFTGQDGFDGAPGPPGPQGIQRLRFVVGPKVTIPPGGINHSDAICPAGETAVTGGFSLISGGGQAHLFQEISIGTAWVAQASNPFAATLSADLTAYAWCSPNVTNAAAATVQDLNDAARAARTKMLAYAQ